MLQVVMHRRSQHIIQKPLSAQRTVHRKLKWKLTNSHINPFRFWLNATITWNRIHPYPIAHCTFLGFISNDVRATVFSTTKTKLDFYLKKFWSLGVVGFLLLHLYPLQNIHPKHLKALQRPAVFSLSYSFYICSWSHTQRKNS